MRKLYIILFVLYCIGVQAQTDTVMYYGDTVRVYRIDAPIVVGDDTITSDSNYVGQYYDFTRTINDTTFNYQPQFFIFDSLGNKLKPITDLLNDGWRSNGTVKEFIVDSNFVNLALVQQRDSLIFNRLKSVFGSSNVTKL